MDRSGGGKRTTDFGLGTFLLAFRCFIPMEWLALIIIIIELVVDLALMSKERCEHKCYT